MSSKLVKYNKEARESIKAGVDKLANAVTVTLGPKGRHVLLKRSWGAPHVTRDGVTIAREIFLKDQFEDMGAQMVKAAASKTCDETGDGTTTATLLAQAIYEQGLQLLAVKFNPIDLKRGLDKAVAEVVGQLESMTKPTHDSAEIAQVGTISANDEEIGKLIADAMDKVGKDGVITIEESATPKTQLEITEGMEFDRGYITPYFVTDIEHATVDLPEAFILLYDGRFEEIRPLVPLLEKVSRSGKPLLIIAEDYGQNCLATLIQNKLKGTLYSCPVKTPGFGERRKEIMKDLAVLTGATLFSKEMGMDIGNAVEAHLGMAKRIIVSRASTTIVGGGGTSEKIQARANQIRHDIEHCDSEYDKKGMRQRLAKLLGGVAIIRVGAPTEPEMKEKKDRVEDAMHATKAAVEEGIVPGGGIALLRCAKAVEQLVEKLAVTGEREGARIILNCLATPLRMIVENAGGKPDIVVAEILKSANPNYGYNAAKDQFEDLIAAGIIDPKKVVRCALQNAASVASMLITTEAMVADDPSEKPLEAGE
jgi:chaperonin GroEL